MAAYITKDFGVGQPLAAMIPTASHRGVDSAFIVMSERNIALDQGTIS